VTSYNPYIYSPINPDGTIKLLDQNNRLARYQVEFPSAISAEHLGNNRIIAEYFLPHQDTRVPLVVIVHGMGDSSLIPCRMIANSLAKRGIASLILYLVFNRKRIPAVIKAKYPRLSPEEWFESYRISVTDVRQAIDWAAGRSEIRQENIAVLGISFGGFIASIALGLDQRLKAGVLIEMAGNSDMITNYSLLLRLQYKMKKDEYRSSQKLYAKYLSEVAAKGMEGVAADKNSYFTDPKTYALSTRTRPILMINAWLDEMIPRKAVLDLWQAFDKPPLCWYPATHATIWMWYPLMGPRIGTFLKTSLT
jgi:cephalosporin-C deacetylase-like acetyl esterase